MAHHRATRFPGQRHYCPCFSHNRGAWLKFEGHRILNEHIRTPIFIYRMAPATRISFARLLGYLLILDTHRPEVGAVYVRHEELALSHDSTQLTGPVRTERETNPSSHVIR